MSQTPQPRTPIDTLFAEAGRGMELPIRTANPPLVRASTVLFDSLEQAAATGRRTAVGARHASTYGTVGTQTTFALMDALAAIEGEGHACRAALMPSGLAAISTALLGFLQPGDHMLMTDSVYGPARVFAQGMLAKLGVQTTFFDPGIDAEGLAGLIRPETKVLYLESPGSYTFELQDVPALAALARSRGIVSMIDNAWASPVFARPFDWGIDISILPLTKYWSGHADLLMGAVVAREEVWGRLWEAVRQLGMCVGGDDAWLVLRGLRTVGVRMRAHQASGLAVASWLESRPEVARVLHPGLPGHPGHDLWQRDFTGASGLFAFELDAAPFAGAAGAERRRRALAALCEGRRLFGIGYSWGGFESLIMPAAIDHLRTAWPWQGGPLVRLHCGLADASDLIADLDEGFAAMAKALG
ncbi:MAG: cystathionine beta-lyase [Burkholderiaceae bacterium]|nr:cystathionine beta-lyase [Burkholderiaceae bacterium]MEB2320428.1 cystathionine beta-lyase [Pseudomonadota bacterium]